ncbi:MAG: DNA adenine methylase [Patescibacteria group bacterium]|nr:DNA adenine methylase [Patescibacteria group bacterium]
MEATPKRPALRYFGGKWRLAPWIIKHFPPHRIYTEVFGGAASVLLRKPRSYAEVYNDLDGEVVNLFRVLQEPQKAEILENLLRITPFARSEYELAKLPCEGEVERARRLIIRSFMGFGSNSSKLGSKSSFRSNTSRSGTIPAHDWANYADALPAIIARFRGVVIENRDAIKVLLAHDSPETLHYVDPPYLHETRSSRHRYDFELREGDHVKLAETLKTLSGMVILSGYPSALYDDLYRGWNFVSREGFSDGAHRRMERLWFNAAAWGAQNERTFLQIVMRK